MTTARSVYKQPEGGVDRKHGSVNVPVSQNFFFEKMARSRFAIPPKIYVPVKARDIRILIRNLIKFAISLAIDKTRNLHRANSQIDVSTREKQCRKSIFYDGKSV